MGPERGVRVSLRTDLLLFGALAAGELVRASLVLWR